MNQLALRVVVALFGTLCGVVASAEDPSIRLTALPGGVRVRPEGPVEGSAVAEVFCARGETESFQVVVSAVGMRLESVTADMSPLENADGQTLAADRVGLFREVFVPVRHSAPRATIAPGWIPDPLVPFTDPYTGEPVAEAKWDGKQLVHGRRFGARGFAVWEGKHQPVWVDIGVPADAAAGLYTGALRVSAANAHAVEMPVRVTVWDFALPTGPTHENHFGHFSRVAAYTGLDPSSEEFHRLEERYIEMMAAHRLNPPLPKHLLPKTADDGTAVFDEDTDRGLTEFVERYHVTNIDVPRAPFGDVLGAGREKAIRFYRSWYAYLERKGWENGAYLYMLDEPNDADAYERVRKLGALVREAEPRLRRLVVEQPYTQNPEWGPLDDAIDIWCPLFGFVHEPSVKRVQAQGDEVWSYTALVQKAPPYHPDYDNVKGDDPPYWQLDFPVLGYRIAPWLNRRYGITGLLYWSTVYWGSPERNPWLDPGFRVRWNGDGALFYPGQEAGIEGPIGSIRLKNLRDGMEDYEYFAILAGLGGEQVAAEIVREAVPTWGSWDQDVGRLIERRQRLAEEILARRGN